MSKEIFKRGYSWEELSDLERDVSEAASPDYNPAMKDIPGEYPGVIRVTMKYFSEVDLILEEEYDMRYVNPFPGVCCAESKELSLNCSRPFNHAGSHANINLRLRKVTAIWKDK